MQHITPHVESVLSQHKDISRAVVVFDIGGLPFEYIAYGTLVDARDSVLYLRGVMVEAMEWMNKVLAPHDVCIHLPDTLYER